MGVAAGNAEGIPVVRLRQLSASTLKGLHNAGWIMQPALRGCEYSGMDGTTGAPPALPAANDILPILGNIRVRIALASRVGTCVICYPRRG